MNKFYIIFINYLSSYESLYQGFSCIDSNLYAIDRFRLVDISILLYGMRFRSPFPHVLETPTWAYLSMVTTIMVTLVLVGVVKYVYSILLRYYTIIMVKIFLMGPIDGSLRVTNKFKFISLLFESKSKSLLFKKNIVYCFYK